MVSVAQSRGSVIGIATGYGLDDPRIGVRVSVGKEFSHLQIIQTGHKARPASYPIGTKASSPWVKRPGRESDHSPPTNAYVKNTWFYSSTLSYDFMV
jgi:hypothetical protein